MTKLTSVAQHRAHIAVWVAACLVFSPILAGCSGPKLPDAQTQEATQEEVAADPTGVGQLLCDLVEAYESPESGAGDAIDADLAEVQTRGQADYDVAKSVAERWKSVYLDESYQLNVWGGGQTAPELAQSGIVDGPTHAFVVLGYELKDGQMTDELRGRCDAAAAAARTYPSTLLVCSGGATGKNNPDKHTEAGLMRDYLVGVCGIDATRVLVDERAMTTAENALNTMEMLKGAGVQTMTIVTSTYHQRWGQVVYDAVAAQYRKQQGYSVQFVGNYSYQITPENPAYEKDDRIAVMQVGQIMGLPEETMEMLPAIR